MELNKRIDHTLLKQDATKAQILNLCEEAKTYDFASVCVNPTWIKTCKESLQESDVMVCTVIGFPLGASLSVAKAAETRAAFDAGADEFDMVLNIGALKDHQDDLVVEDIKAVIEAAQGKTVKVIIETCLLSEEEKIRACNAVVSAKADFVKTSTGFSTNGATLEDVKLLKASLKGLAKVKAAGGVRSFEDLQNFVEAGADRIGTSSGVKLLEGHTTINSY